MTEMDLPRMSTWTPTYRELTSDLVDEIIRNRWATAQELESWAGHQLPLAHQLQLHYVVLLAKLALSPDVPIQ